MNGLEQFADFQMSAEEKQELKDTIKTMDESIPRSTKAQRGYIAGMCKLLGYDPHDLPDQFSISGKDNTRNMNIVEAGELIDILEPMYHAEKEETYYGGLF